VRERREAENIWKEEHATQALGRVGVSVDTWVASKKRIILLFITT